MLWRKCARCEDVFDAGQMHCPRCEVASTEVRRQPVERAETIRAAFVLAFVWMVGWVWFIGLGILENPSGWIELLCLLAVLEGLGVIGFLIVGVWIWCTTESKRSLLFLAKQHDLKPLPSDEFKQQRERFHEGSIDV